MKRFFSLIVHTLHTIVSALTPARGVFGIGVGQSGAYPDLQTFLNNIPNRSGDVEIIKWSLYDSAIYIAAGQTSLNFFQTPIGQGTSTQSGASAQTKQLGDTNMTQAGMLPNPQGFFINSIQIMALPGSTAAGTTDWKQQIPSNYNAAAAAAVQAGENDVYTMLAGGALTLTIGQKPYLQDAPLVKFPPAQRFELQTSTGIATTVAATTPEILKATSHAGGNLYVLNPGIGLMSGQNFNVKVEWPVVMNLPSAFNGKLIVTLEGWLYRGVQ